MRRPDAQRGNLIQKIVIAGDWRERGNLNMFIMRDCFVTSFLAMTDVAAGLAMTCEESLFAPRNDNGNWERTLLYPVTLGQCQLFELIFSLW